MLAHADIITNIKVQSVIRHFLAKKREDSLNIMTAVMKNVGPLDGDKSNSDDDFAFIISQSTGDILQIERMNNEDYFTLNLDRLKISRGAAAGHVLHYDYVDAQVYVCSTDVLKAF